ncbi:ABC transporter B family member 20-like [Cynara cardunculus var. scolymus]|uniref:ABC transporter B family member 20-like n=1 Tax=Cynara cardunculus var. scolymus TaxID=59895 RepID=UPI000D62CF51|nr:ABC transporter B family member 20-like [Cynara cardunculus var. scolymus]
MFGWTPPHGVGPLTPVSENSEVPDSPLPYLDTTTSRRNFPEKNDDIEEEDEVIPPSAVPFTALFACADGFDWILIAVGSLAAVVHGASLAVYLHLFGKIIHLLSFHSNADELFNHFSQHALYIVYIGLAVFAAGWIEVWCWILTAERQTAVIRTKYVQVILNQNMSFFDAYGHNGDIVSQVLTDVQVIHCVLGEKVGNYVHNIATFLGGLVIAFVNCWQIALVALATGPIIVAAGALSDIYLHKFAESLQDAYVDAARVAEEALSNIRTLYAFTNEALAKYSYASSLHDTLKYGIIISLVQGLGLGFTYGLGMCSCALQLWVGGFLVTNGKSSGAEIVTAVFAMILSGLGMNQAWANLYSFEQGRIAAYRLYGVTRHSASAAASDGNTLVSVQGKIEFRNVYFSYPSCPVDPILSGFYLTVPAKKTVALVGRSGSGKSSLIPLLERHYDPTLGEVLLDGVNTKSLKLEWFRRQIGLVTQEPALTCLSITDNIAYGRPNITFKQIEEAAKIAHVHAFINSLENGYETQVGKVGLELTDEQKIKISVARAVLLNPSIILLDEVTSKLDLEAEKSVQEVLRIIMLGRSTIMIARKLSLVKYVDLIAVMEGGQCVEMGTHDELISAHGLYSEILRCEEVVKLPVKLPSGNHNVMELKAENDSGNKTALAMEKVDSLEMRSTADHKDPQLKDKYKSKHQTSPSLGRLVKLNLPEWLYAVLGSLGASIFGSFRPILAYVVGLIVTAYYRVDGSHNIKFDVNKWCLIISCMAIVILVATVLQHFYFGIMGEKMTERVRRMMFSAMLQRDVGWFDKDENGSDNLLMNLANDATYVCAAFSNRLSILVQDFCAAFAAIIIGFSLEWRLALVALATIPFLTVSAAAQRTWLSGFSRGIEELHKQASLVLEDVVRNISTVMAYCAGNEASRLYSLYLKKVYRRAFLHGMSIGFVFGFSRFLLFACNAVLLWYTAVSVRNGYIDLPTALREYIVFSFATFSLVEPFGLAVKFHKKRKNLVRVFDIIDHVPKIGLDESSALKPVTACGTIEFKNVNFCYPTSPEIMVLRDFSVKVDGGHTVGVVGVSGSGKSTLLSLILRFYDPVSGQILLDGKDLKHFNLRWLRNQLGFVQQEPVIFSTTIRENIIYARRHASETEIRDAARIANAHHFISSLPQGYDTRVGPDGVDLTPGQKLRIAIARVVLKNAPILLLDEADSTIEHESRRVVQEALDTLLIGGKTTILVARRASMMRRVDKILVVNGGQIVEQGTHDSLAAIKDGVYAKLTQPHFVKGLRPHFLGSRR